MFQNINHEIRIPFKTKPLLDFTPEEMGSDVSKVEVGLYTQTEFEFKLKIKMEEASNFNACLAKPKNSQKGKGKPRNWYEIEINSPTKFNEMEGYLPVDEAFTVITDDGYSFECKRNGTKGKNLQSTPNLQILGKWLKGKLMQKDLIHYGEKGTTEMLDKFGTHFLTIRKLKKEGHWLFCFGAEK